MNWNVITVSRSDLALAIGAIRLGGGTVAATRLSGDDVTITYFTTRQPVPSGGTNAATR